MSFDGWTFEMLILFQPEWFRALDDVVTVFHGRASPPESSKGKLEARDCIEILDILPDLGLVFFFENKGQICFFRGT